MSTTFIASPQALKDLRAPSTRAAVGLSELASFANRLAYDVETGWGLLRPEIRDALKELVEDVSHPPRGLRGVAHYSIGFVTLAWALFRDSDAVGEYLAATKRLIAAVRSALETDASNALLDAVRAGQPVPRSEELRALAARAVANNRPPDDIDAWADRLAQDISHPND